MNSKELITQLLQLADIQINGPNPWDIHVHEDKLYDKVLSDPSLGLGEGYMDRLWDCDQVDTLLERILRAQLDKKLQNNFKLSLQVLFHRLFNHQSRRRSSIVAKKHYDISNDLYRAMLGPTMVYSCAYWKRASTLDQAQIDKMELICQKLMLKPGMTLLDIGCGWGSLAKYAAEHYGVTVKGITISERQKEYAEEHCKGLPIQILLQDYRDVEGTYDRVVSVGMFEHVGYKNYPTYMRKVKQVLREDGLFLLHTLGANATYYNGDNWMTKYIFPNGMLPSVQHIAKSAEGSLILEDWHNFGLYYEQTLRAWHQNFNAHWPVLKSQYDERFYRMWNYYLLSCMGSFRARAMQLWQIVFSPRGFRGGYYIRDLK